MSRPKISIICVTFNSADVLPGFLQSVEQLSREWAETVFIDNASSDKTLELIKNWGKARELIANPENRGWSAANNQGAAASRGGLLFFANPDVQFEAGALQALVRFLDDNLEFAAVAPQLLNPDGTIQSSCRTLPTVADLFFQISGLAVLFPGSFFNRWKMPGFDHQSFREVEQPMASAFLIRRAVFEKAWGLDERFFVFFGDVDLARRLKQTGFRTAFRPEAKMTHRRGASTRKMGMRFYFSSHSGFFRYLWKWAGPFEKAILPFLWPLVLATAVGRALLHFFRRR